MTILKSGELGRLDNVSSLNTDDEILIRRLDDSMPRQAQLLTINSEFITNAARLITQVNADYTAQTTDEVILVDACAAPVTITLYDTTDNDGRQLTIKKIDLTSNAMIIDGSGAQTIDGDLTVSTTTPYNSFDVLSNGANWDIV